MKRAVQTRGAVWMRYLYFVGPAGEPNGAGLTPDLHRAELVAATGGGPLRLCVSCALR